MNKPTRLSPILGTVGAALGTFFSAFSTHDYALHLDRQLHGTHCSFVPGLVDTAGGDNACTAAMYSPYSALFRKALWGGIPIALLGLGAFAFFLVASIALLISPQSASRRIWQAYGLTALTPLLASLVMFVISLLKVHAFCKLCMGMYFGSILLAAAGALALIKIVRPAAKGMVPADPFVHDPPRPGHIPTQPMAPVGYQVQAGPPYGASNVPSPMPLGSALGTLVVLATLGAFVLLPALVYAASMPDYRTKIVSCGAITQPTEKHGALVKLATLHPKRPALLFVDPLCPTCKAFHERLEGEGIFEQLDVSVAIFPLDNDCNWMVDRALHPGACELARGFLCSADKAREFLEWSYDNQSELEPAGKAGKEAIRAKIRTRFVGLEACMDSKETKQRLDRTLQFAVTNKIPVSTPQMMLGAQRICDEDTDLGMAYTMKQIAPEVFSP